MTVVVIFSYRELFPHYFWLITDLARDQVGAEELLARDRARGKAENTFGKLKSTLRAQLPSSPRPKHHYAGKTIDRSESPVRQERRPQNEAILLLAMLGYQTMHEGRCAMESASGMAGASAPSAKRFCARPPCGPARKAHEIPYRTVRRELLVHSAGTAEEVHHAKRVVHTPSSRPSPTHPEAGSAEPWHPAAQTSG